MTNNTTNTPALITKEWENKAFLFRKDGYFNMTKAAQAFGKRVDNFMASPDAKDYIEALSLISSDKEVVKVQRGSGKLPQVGTWGHPKLAVFFARWWL